MKTLVARQECSEQRVTVWASRDLRAPLVHVRAGAAFQFESVELESVELESVELERNLRAGKLEVCRAVTWLSDAWLIEETCAR